MIIRRRKRKRRKNPRAKRRLNVLQTKKGKRALRRHNRFWGLKGVPKIKKKEVPGIATNEPWVGLGRSPGIVIANGPTKSKTTKEKLIKAAGELVSDARGRKMIWLRRRGKGANGKGLIKRFLGWASKVIYIPYKDIEKAGSKKSRTEWHHEMGEHGGKRPKAYLDNKGNIHLGEATYRVAAKSDQDGVGWIMR